MRMLPWLIALAALVSASSLAAADKKNGKPADKQDAEAASGVEEKLKEIFEKADRNHNSLLNKSEFKKAQVMLNSAIAQMGRDGLIGKAKPPKKNSPLGAPVVNAPDLSKNNKITQPEFMLYAEAQIQQADDAIRKQRQDFANQQRMRAAYGRSMRGR